MISHAKGKGVEVHDKGSRFTYLLLLLLLTGCKSLAPAQEQTEKAESKVFYLDGSWQVQTLENHSSTDTAADSVKPLLETHLRERGIEPTGRSPNYSIEGSILRWYYTGSASVRPVAALSLSVRDPLTQNILWHREAVDTGHRGQSLTALADTVLATLVKALPLSKQGKTMARTVELQAGSSLLALNSAMATVSNVGSMSSDGEMSDTLLPTFPVKTEQSLSVGSQALVNQPMEDRAIAFFYGNAPPVDVLMQFDRLVLEPDNINRQQLEALTQRGARAYAYLSVGEVGPTRAYAKDLDPLWIIGKNPTWNSQILDLSNHELRKYLLSRAVTLQANGYEGLFLDTMDSFNLLADTDEKREKQAAGLISLVAELATRLPNVKIITNRGFEVLDAIAPYVEAVAAESLYAGWNHAKQHYRSVPAGDRDWLLSKLNHARKNLGLEVIAIDYLAPSQRAQARVVAAKIANHGFTPWVANPELNYVGVGSLEVVPRKVLLIYNSNFDVLEESPVHTLVAMPIEYMGYVPEYLDIAQQPLPGGELKGRYAGIVTWANRPFDNPDAKPWLQKQLDDAVPVALLGVPPVVLDGVMSQSLGIEVTGDMHMNSARLAYSDEYIDPERSLSERIDSISLIAESTALENTSHMRYVDQNDRSADVVVTGPFGGFAWQPGLVDDELDYLSYWVVEPFKFLRTALQLPDVPMPDVTTENGKRMWLAHIDGDALPSWAEMPGKKLGAEVLYDEILSKFPYPHTVSIVEGEMTEISAYDDRRERMFDIVRKIFRLDSVELASHTYSHPFKWGRVGKESSSGKYNLAIEGYTYSAEREITGSIDFINRELAPPGKQLEVFLWSGDALPLPRDMAVLDRLGLPNMNGGLTSITRLRPAKILVSPMARPVGDYLQVYAPVMNENLYTNDWLGPFDGFKHVIETFQMTEYPKRLKPINIYYHFYSGTKISALRALKKAYEWSVDEDIFPLYVSDYSRKVSDFHQAGVARYLNGQWKLSGLGHVHSIRMLDGNSWPDLSQSDGLTGVRKLHDGVYIHTNGADQVLFSLSKNKPNDVHLVSSNGRVEQWSTRNGRLSLRIRGEVPVTIELGGSLSSACVLSVNDHSVRAQLTSDNTLMFTFSKKDTGNAALNCPA